MDHFFLEYIHFVHLLHPLPISLIATKIDRAFGLELAQERPALLLAHVGAEHEKTREAALAFLTTVSEEDFGNDVDAWSTWIKQADLDQ